MSGNKSGQTSNTAAVSAPWGPTQPGLQMGINAANSAFQSGIGSQPYTNSMVVPFAQQSTDAFNRMTSLANQFQPAMTAGMTGVGNLAKMGGLNPLQNLSVAQLKPIATGQRMTGNPYLDEVIRRSSGDITGAENLGASAAGRYGSGGHQAATQKAIGDMSSGLRFSDYNTQQQRMDAAIASLFNAGQQQWSNVTALPGQLATGYQTAQMPAGTLRSVGGEYENLMKNTLNDQQRVFQETQAQPWQQIGYLNNALLGGGYSNFGTRMGSASEPGTSRLMGGLGGAVGGGALLGPWGALAGGLAGAFG